METLSLQEAKEALHNNLKISHIGWPPVYIDGVSYPQYVYINEDNILVDENDALLNLATFWYGIDGIYMYQSGWLIIND